MTVAVHDVKDAIDQMIEMASIVAHRMNELPESEDRDEVLADMRAVRSHLTRARPRVESLRRR